MKRCLLSFALCLVSSGVITAGEPSEKIETSKAAALPKASAPAAGTPLLKPAPNLQVVPLTGRRKLEAQLQAPADLDFGQRLRISAREILGQLHERHHLSIRFDVPTLASLFGSEPVASKKCQVAGQTLPAAYWREDITVPGQTIVPVAGRAGRTPVLSPATAASTPTVGATTTVPAAAAAYRAPAPAPAANSPAPAAAPAPAANTTTPVAAPAPAADSPAPVAAPAAAPVAKPSLLPVTTDDRPAPQPLGERKPEPTPQSEGDSPATSEKSSETKETLTHLLDVEIDVQMIELKSVSVATVLRHVLDAAPLPAGAEDFLGLPIPLTNAMLLDYLVEDDGLLITTRMRALTHKETRVYSVKHLKDLAPEQLARTICQAVRPWSWRSQIADMGNQLKGTPLPPETLGAILKTGAQLVGSELGATISIADDTTTRVASGSVVTADGATPAAGKNAQTDEAKTAAMMGNAMVNGFVTFLQATLASLEMFHYAEPPTATIQTLPGKLVITQSQTAHREIAEFLEQLAEE